MEITLKDKQSALEQKITIYQYKRDAIILSQKEYDIPADGEIIEVDFKANVDCYAEIPYDCYDWIRQTTTRGLVEHKLYFDISANTTGEERKGIIIINSGSNVSDTIYINQVPMSLSKTVNVEKTGSLPELISDNEKFILKELKVIGKINGTDIRFIREMAGRNEVGEPTLGSLTYLDLSDVRILEGGDWYYYDVSYTDWQKRFIYTVSNEVGENMFRECKLQTVILPDNITAIRKYAFCVCNQLSKINIPDKVETIGERCFALCTEIINIHSKMLNPISVDYSVFYGIDKEICTLYVPQGSKSSYQDTEIWGDFKNIVEE